MQQKVALRFSGHWADAPVTQPKTEEFLNLRLWSADLLVRPTFRKLTDSYESWAYRNGLLRQVATLQEHQLIERDAWLDAVTHDSLLPGLRRAEAASSSQAGRILPADSRRQQAWRSEISHLPLEIKRGVGQSPTAGPAVATCRTVAGRRRTHVQPRRHRRRPRVTVDEFVLHTQHTIGRLLGGRHFHEDRQNQSGARDGLRLSFAPQPK
ncbi:MAG: hypothetical protein KIS67_04010 [Verrucomicrobiae bacterium]|nr:hypothetical protein [Verrucomicrobiae bacterium]